jgi:haloalkane dehalogenase
MVSAEPIAAPAWLPAAFHDVIGRRLDIAGARLHVREEGSGPPLLMLHGNPTWSFLYREIIAGLRDRSAASPSTSPASASPKPRPVTASPPPSTPRFSAHSSTL